MLRSIRLIRGDIRFQWKYGFYYIYAILVLLYMGVLSMLRGEVKEVVCNIMIYSDPAAMGLFFMGAIVLLEKSQRVLNSIAVSPVKKEEYIIGKMCSIGLISLLVGLVLLARTRTDHVLMACVGILSASFCFTLCGIFVGTKADSLTGYIVGTIPFEIMGFLPPIAYLFGWKRESVFMLFHPGCAQIQLISGNQENLQVALASSVLWVMILFLSTAGSVKKMFQCVGGVKL